MNMYANIHICIVRQILSDYSYIYYSSFIERVP